MGVFACIFKKFFLKSHSPFYHLGGDIKQMLPFAMIDTAGITGLSMESFKDNWSSDYQFTNDAGIPDPKGQTYWNFK